MIRDLNDAARLLDHLLHACLLRVISLDEHENIAHSNQLINMHNQPEYLVALIEYRRLCRTVTRAENVVAIHAKHVVDVISKV